MNSNLLEPEIDKIGVKVSGAAVEFAETMRTSREFMEMGCDNTGVLLNSCLAASGAGTGLLSLAVYGQTTHKGAKVCYCVSCILSGSAVTSSRIAALSRTCKVSKVGALSEAFVITFLMAGNRAHAQALQLEGKPVPEGLRRYMKQGVRRPDFKSNGNVAGFIIPGNCHLSSEIIEKIPFYKIGKFIGVGFSVYAYGKLVIIAYRYTQRLITKFKKRRKSILLKQYNSIRLKNLALVVITSSYYGQGKFSRLIRVYNFFLFHLHQKIRPTLTQWLKLYLYAF